MSLNCNSYESELIAADRIGVCTGTCDDDSECLSSCECYSVDLDWQPNLQDYATCVICCHDQSES